MQRETIFYLPDNPYVPEIEHIIISFLNFPEDYKILTRVSKYYNHVITNVSKYREFRDFCQKKDHLELDSTVDNAEETYRNFYEACRYNYLNIAKHLFTTCEINIHLNDEYAFRKSYTRGNNNIANWLLDIGNKLENPIDIRVRNDALFRWSCMRGHLELRKNYCI